MCATLFFFTSFFKLTLDGPTSDFGNGSVENKFVPLSSVIAAPCSLVSVSGRDAGNRLLWSEKGFGFDATAFVNETAEFEMFTLFLRVIGSPGNFISLPVSSRP